MELRQYLSMLIHWAWLLILGLILGVLGGYLASRYETPIYQASTKVLIMQAPEERIQNLYASSNQQLSQTFTELLVTRPIIAATSERLGYNFSAGQVRVQRVRDAELIQIIVQDDEPNKAAEIANTLVKVFLEQNEALQSSRFASTEESLLAQRQQVEQQISSLQTQLTELSQERLDSQIAQVTKSISDLQAEISTLQEEIVRLEYSSEPVMVVDSEGHRSWALPTPSVDQRVDLTSKNNRLVELQSLLSLYQNLYVQLTFSQDNPALSGSRNTDQIQAALSLYQQIYATLLSNYETVRLSRMNSTPNVVQVEEALPPGSPIRPRPLTNMTFGGIAGLILAGVIAFLREYLDDTLQTPEDIENVLEMPVLANIGEMHAGKKSDVEPLPHVIEQSRSPISEAFRTLRTNLEFAEVDRPLQTLLITSAGVSEGKTTIAANLAIVIAQAGRRVVLLDADLRRPRVHEFLNLPNRIGLSDVLRDHASLQSVAQKYRADRLSVITSGNLPPNPVEVLSSEKMGRILSDMKREYDTVIIDGPPFLLADASVLAAKVDGVLLVIQSKHTQATHAMSMLDQLERAGARIVGVALNRIQVKEPHYYYRDLKHYASYSYDGIEIENESGKTEGKNLDMVEGKAGENEFAVNENT